ncbi:hypothetical protein GGX14DRAFT_393467 [Mycena pura]|uniref:Uncharacterized protein n=1 Tax=Mycena pura TaxID=153505 RepID=A0AAD6YEK6_9AGAR|nr:hypothetical protein GGX14DRAFT_393467 [Mycena pura]
MYPAGGGAEGSTDSPPGIKARLSVMHGSVTLHGTSADARHLHGTCTALHGSVWQFSVAVPRPKGQSCNKSLVPEATEPPLRGTGDLPHYFLPTPTSNSTTGNQMCAKKLVEAPTDIPVTALHVAASVVQSPVTSAGAASMIPPSGTGNNPRRLEFKKKLIETSKGAVHCAVVALDLAASLTQNVPYLGAISKVLVEISKIADVCSRE